MSSHDGRERALLEMLDALPERVVRYRLHDREVLYCNAAKAAAYGLTPSQLVGRSLDDLLTRAELDSLTTQLKRLSLDRPLARSVAAGGGRWIEWVDQLVDGPDGAEVLSVGRDVTERYRAEARLRESERRFLAAMDEAPIGMAIVDLDARMVRVNPALCEFLGRSEDELLTMTTLDVTHPDDVDTDLDYGRRVVEDDTHPGTLEKRFVRPDGGVVWGLVRASLVRGDDGEPLYTLGQVVDITERVEREQTLRRTAAEEHEAAEELRRRDDTKNTFLSAVSHELRTPLTAIQGFAEVLEARHDDLPAEQRREMVCRLADNARRLTGMLSDLLDVDRLARGGQVEARRVDTDLAELVTDVVAGVDTSTHEVTTEVTPVHLAVDPPKIERVVDNLLVNALRHTPAGTPVQVRVRPEDGGARITVEDVGPGVPDDVKETIFEPFDRGVSDGTKVSGTGIGLSLVSRFAALHGGRAWVEDRPGGGASFHVQLPAGAGDDP